MNFTPRSHQQSILNYTGGTLGISAVPGSGKTHILSALAAQIIAVADAYQAMTASRPYRPALSAKAALRELRANSGTQFNPVVVEAFIKTVVGERRKSARGAESPHQQVYQ